MTTKSRFTGELRPFIQLWQWKILDNAHKLWCVNYKVQKHPSLSADSFSKGVDQNNLYICVQDLWSDILFSQLSDPFFSLFVCLLPCAGANQTKQKGQPGILAFPVRPALKKKIEIGPCHWTPDQGAVYLSLPSRFARTPKDQQLLEQQY